MQQNCEALSHRFDVCYNMLLEIERDEMEK